MLSQGFPATFLVIWCVQATLALGLSLLGCPSDAAQRSASQKRMERLFLNLRERGPGGPRRRPEEPSDEELYSWLSMLMDENSGTSGLIHEPTEATGYATSHHPLPCAPGIFTTELLQFLWMWKTQSATEEVKQLVTQSDRHWAFLRISPWMNVLKLGYGSTFAAGHELCTLVPAPPEAMDLERAARRFHAAWPGSTTTEATIFKQFHVLTAVDYRSCTKGRRCQRWLHRRFVELALRQPFACGVVCRYAAAFAYLAQALTENRGRRRWLRKWSEDQEKLVEDAQAQILLADGIFYTLLGPQQVQLTCSLTRSFPIFSLLARLSGIPMSLGDSNSNPRDEAATNPTLKLPNQPPPPTLAKLCDLIDQWPPLQRLTAQGAVAVYSMLQSLGSLLDEFQIKWWMSSGALLGTLRNGGMLPQDCDVDIAIWRPDAHEMLSPKFQAALAAAGLVSFHMPIYFQYRFCLVQVPAAADPRSVQGGLACHLPYVDAHLADVAEEGRWHYIHRTDLQYAHSFPLKGILGSQKRDLRQRRFFGDAKVWIPNLPQSEEYLNTVYGEDWRNVLRGRHGAMIHNLSAGESFWGMIARPTGPLRDVIREQKLIGNLLPGAAVTCSHDCDHD